VSGAIVHASPCTVTTESTVSMSSFDACMGTPPDHEDASRHTPLPPNQRTM
jgi:hypothetical protein